MTVTVTNPTGCPPTSLTINAAPCPKGDQPLTPPGSEGSDDDGGGGGGCLIGRTFVALLLASALFMLLVGLCVPGAAPSALIAAAALAIAGGVAFGIWWFLCGSKCAALLIMWQVTMIGAWVSAFLATCCLPSLILAIVLGVAALGLFTGWITTCKPKKCKIFSELLWVYVAAIGTIFAYLTKLAPCGLPTIPLITAAIAAALAIAIAATCK